jgi:hypothetical protein
MTKTLKPMEMLNDCHAEWRQSSMKKLIEETKNTEGKGLESIPYCGAIRKIKSDNESLANTAARLLLSLHEKNLI